jgi:hypothetical protein
MTTRSHRRLRRIVCPGIAQWSEDQAGQFPGAQHKRPMMGRLGCLRSTCDDSRPHTCVVPSDAVCVLAQIVPEIGLARARQRCGVADTLSRRVRWPRQAGKPTGRRRWISATHMFMFKERDA